MTLLYFWGMLNPNIVKRHACVWTIFLYHLKWKCTSVEGGSGISNTGLNFVLKQMDCSTDKKRILAEGAIALSVTLSGGALFAS